MSGKVLPLTHFKVSFGIEAPNAQAEAVISAAEEAKWSNVVEINDELMPKSNYATAELNQFILGGNKKLFPDDSSKYVKDKYTSSNTSNIDCEYEIHPTINIQFTNLQTLAGLTFVFDEMSKNFPTLMKLTAYDGETVLKEVLATPDDVSYISEAFDNVRALKIEILKSNLPFLRAIVSRIYFGIVKVFTEADSEKVEQTYSLSPINNNLYKSEFKITLDNFNLQYNIDNKKGIYTYLTEQQPISIEYSLDGSEWIECGEYLTSGKAKISNNLATIESIDQIQFMNDIYKKDVYRTTAISLYDLAESVLLDFGWFANQYGEYPFEIDESLKNITTLGTLPMVSHGECLQIIASVGGVALYVDDRGYICLKPLPTEVSDKDYVIDFNNASNYPEPEEIEPLSEVEVTIHGYSTEAEVSEIHKSNYVLEGDQTLKIEYEFSNGQTVTVPSGVTLKASRFYGRYCELDVTGTGTFEIIVKGTRVVDNTSTLTIVNQTNGEVAPLDNPLITDSARANVVGTIAKDYLKQRIRYTIPWVQDYRVNVGDLVYIKTQFSEQLLCRVLEIKTSEPAMTGTMKVVVISGT
jgi:hypothetical protein